MTTKNKVTIGPIAENWMNNLPPSSLAEVIEGARDRLELSKAVMAEKLGMTRGAYGTLVNGSDSPSEARAANIAKTLGHPEKLFVQFAISDRLKKANLQYEVILTPVKTDVAL